MATGEGRRGGKKTLGGEWEGTGRKEVTVADSVSGAKKKSRFSGIGNYIKLQQFQQFQFQQVVNLVKWVACWFSLWAAKDVCSCAPPQGGEGLKRLHHSDGLAPKD